MEIVKEGRRFYAKGAPFALKDSLKNLGFSWDGEKRAWWTGKKDAADKAASLGAAQPESAAKETVAPDAKVLVGRVKYKGKTYYLLYDGWSKKDPSKRVAKLSARDGSFVFWAKEGEPLEILARYEEKRSIDGLKAFAERKKREDQDRAEGRQPKNWRPCGYPGCHFAHCDECDGEGFYGF